MILSKKRFDEYIWWYLFYSCFQSKKITKLNKFGFDFYILGAYIYFKWRDRLESKIFYAVLILTTGYSLFLFLTGAIRWLLKISILMCWSHYQLTCKIWKTLQFAYSKVFFPSIQSLCCTCCIDIIACSSYCMFGILLNG